ncbi:sialidase family protein [Sphingobacterium deserti]|uniref:exo-alpha-sialidase n=1 Tax=Sphingobacterium deserti TaxID=1229276 RepID=A0A0B8T3X1_9SPHI|nr:sialidase family protein [Sphingobacterium deserti]KGE13938.1 neuraminidase [Sphingobacterium deserti]
MTTQKIYSSTYFLVVILSMILLFGCGGQLGEPVPDDYFDRKRDELVAPYIYQKGYKGYACFRIPALVRSPNGSLLAFAEARKDDCADDGNIDLVLRRSEDNGLTWSDMEVIWDAGEHTAGNPAPVVDKTTGEIHLLMCRNNDQVYVSRSKDEGRTWSTPSDITAAVKKQGWTWYATGPVHGIQIEKGPHAGRLVIPCDHTGNAHTIYSDDHGETWKLGGVATHPVYKPNECTVAELSNGDLLLNMRAPNSDKRRLLSTSKDGGLSWSNPEVHQTLIDPVCQGSMLTFTDTDGKPILLFANAAHETRRRNMTLRLSGDDGKTYPKEMLIYGEFAAYSDMALIDNNTLAMLYERGASDANEGIAFERIDLKNLK